MRPVRRFIALFALLLAAAPAAVQAQAQAGEWVSYRDAYRAMVVFQKYGGPKNLLVSQMQVVPRDHAAALEGLQLTLAGRSSQLHLPLDQLGRTVFPLQKAAYDENASLVLNRKGVAFSLHPQISIAARADGVYDLAELRAACGQALGFARYVDASQRARQCAGVRFVFARRGEAGMRLRREGGEQPLPATGGGEEENFPSVSYRFGAAGEHGQVMTSNAPLAIVPVFD